MRALLRTQHSLRVCVCVCVTCARECARVCAQISPLTSLHSDRRESARGQVSGGLGDPSTSSRGPPLHGHLHPKIKCARSLGADGEVGQV